MHQDLTAVDAAVISALDGMTTKSGADFPEAQLIALQQVGLGTGLTYAVGSERFVVLTTDASYHEGAPHPVVADMAAALLASDVTPIFAVTSSVMPVYQTLLTELSDDYGIEGTVVELASDSSNLAAAIEAGLFLDLVGGPGRDLLTGNSLRNTIDGGARADVIDGARGDDVLIGGTGNDTLTGGEGADTFVFENDPMFRGTDTVMDYVDGTDTLRLTGYGGIGYGDLTIVDGVSGAEIYVPDAEDAPIAILVGVSAATLDAGDVFFV